jgi:hypothetical protein
VNSQPVAHSFPVGALLAGIGAVAAVVGSLMVWWEQAASSASATPAIKVTGWDLDGGKIAALLGALALVMVFVWVLRLEHPLPPFRTSGMVIGSSEAIVAALGIGILVIALINYGDASKANIGPGFWLTLVSGVCATAGGILGLMSGRAQA